MLSCRRNWLDRPRVVAREVYDHDRELIGEKLMLEQPSEDKYVDVRDLRTRYWMLGDEGPPLVLIHGIGASVESWAANVHPLSRTHRVYALDLVGFGAADKPAAPYTLSYLAQFVADFMRSQDIERASIVGHSLGGGVALKLALGHAEKVDKLVLVSSAGLGREGHIFFRLGSLPLVGDYLTRPNRERTAQFLEEMVYDPEMVTEELVDLSYDLMSRSGAQEAYLSTLRSLATVFGTRKTVLRSIVDRLDRITAPTLVVWGEQDEILPVAQAHVAAEGIPQARLHIFQECGHYVPLEKAEAFNALVSEFLNSESAAKEADDG
jgi:4,5:9,10-diseco-3-hydroxy-5,9,17-trioxoandrosta-1(10),2-diene-4-oate hydrolase